MSLSVEQAMIEQDQDELLAVIRICFQEIPEDVEKEVRKISSLDMLQRLILVAANAASWDVFVEELRAGDSSFRLLGERFNPVK